MTDWIVDTNVIATANLEADHVGEECVKACNDFLGSLGQSDDRVVLDTDGHILKEYLGHRVDGQPPVGERFVRWLLQVRADSTWCEQVRITPSTTEDGRASFDEFPDSVGLAGFDDDDRKFVAAARALATSATIVNATDPVWGNYGQALAEEGVEVRCLCPDVVAC